MQRQVGRWWRAWYSTRRWREMRKRLLQRKPYCLYCKKREGRIVKATVADHIIPHKGNPTLFWDEDNLQPLCKRCHDSDKAREESGGNAKIRFGADGYPIQVPGGSDSIFADALLFTAPPHFFLCFGHFASHARARIITVF